MCTDNSPDPAYTKNYEESFSIQLSIPCVPRFKNLSSLVCHELSNFSHHYCKIKSCHPRMEKLSV